MASSASSSKKRSRQQRILRIRHQIDICDQKLTALLMRRLALGKKIQRIKKNLGYAPRDLAREKEILSKISRGHPQLSKAFLKKIYSALFAEVRRK